MTWSTETFRNHSFQLLRQGEEMECGLCCLAMCLNQVWGDTPSTASIKGMMGSARARANKDIPEHQIHPYSASTQDKTGMTSTLIHADTEVKPTKGGGTRMEPLAKYAALYKLDMIYGDSGRAAIVMNVKKGFPMIIRVDWSKGGGSHWVVVPMALEGGFVVLDPIYGLHFNDSATDYKALGADGEVWGRWSDEWLLVAGVLRDHGSESAPVMLPGLADKARNSKLPPPLPPRDDAPVLPPRLDLQDLPPPLPARTLPLPVQQPPLGTPHPLDQRK